jgi:hypothetical protein
VKNTKSQKEPATLKAVPHTPSRKPSTAQPQPGIETSAALQQPQEESILTSEIEYTRASDESLHNAMLQAYGTLYRRDDETRWFRRDVVIPICKEIIARYKRPGVAGKYRLNDQPTVEAYFASIPMSYSTVRSWISREKDETLGLEWTMPDDRQKLTPLEQVVETHKTAGETVIPIEELENVIPQRYGRSRPPRQDKLAELARRLVHEVEALYNGQLALMPKKLADIIEKINAELGAGHKKPPVSVATPELQEKKEG